MNDQIGTELDALRGIHSKITALTTEQIEHEEVLLASLATDYDAGQIDAVGLREAWHTYRRVVRVGYTSRWLRAGLPHPAHVEAQARRIIREAEQKV